MGSEMCIRDREVRVMPIRFIFVPEDSVWMLKSVRGPKNVEK